MAILPYDPYGFIYQGSITGCDTPVMREFLWESTLSGWMNDMAAAGVGINANAAGRAPFGKVYPLPLAFNGSPLIFSAPIGAIQSFRYISNEEGKEVTTNFFIKNSNKTGTPVYAQVIADPNAIYQVQFGVNVPAAISLQATWGGMLIPTYSYIDSIKAADGTTNLSLSLIAGLRGVSQQGLTLCGNGDGVLNNINNQFAVLGLAKGFTQNATGDTYPHYNVTLANQWFTRSWPCT